MVSSSYPRDPGHCHAEPPRNDPRAGFHAGPEPDAVEPLLENLKEMREYLDHYVDVRIDQLRVWTRATTLSVACLIVAIGIAGTMLATAVILFLHGLSIVIGETSGAGVGTGEAIVGAAVLLGSTAGAWAWSCRRQTTERKRIIEKYEHRKQAERNSFGNDISQQAAS
jgi:hypothetical protein